MSHTSRGKYGKHGGRVLSQVPVIAVALLLSSQLQARAFTTEAVGGTTVRCSSSPYSALPETVLDRYSLRPRDDAGLLSCVIQRQDDSGSWRNQQAVVEAQSSTLIGTREELQIREILDESSIGYIGTYALPTNGPLSFDVVAEADDQIIRIQFDDLNPDQ